MPDAPLFGAGGGVAMRPRGTARRAGRTRPSRTSWASRPLSLPARASTGSRRATGRPRSTMSTAAPALTQSIRALKPFFASVMLAFLIWL
ncbi:MAG: hypothetical protein Q7R30_14225 [Acidobacteriota bacterium]|nr:hypothetical protein [Acidobacteriota bacterium]